MTRPARLFALFGVVLVVTIIGPFETGRLMPFLPRFGYWAALVFCAYAIGYTASEAAFRLAPSHLAQRIAISGGLTAFGVAAAVFLLNGFALAYWPEGEEAWRLVGRVALIAVVVSAIFQVAYSEDRPVTRDHGTAAAAPALLERLPLERRGQLVALSVEDHYVRVRTNRGEELLLMRLGDAILETAPVEGLRVHRSHWIALGAVKAAVRRGDGARLTMRVGPDIPVSRANVAAIREAGLLPK